MKEFCLFEEKDVLNFFKKKKFINFVEKKPKSKPNQNKNQNKNLAFGKNYYYKQAKLNETVLNQVNKIIFENLNPIEIGSFTQKNLKNKIISNDINFTV